VQASLPCLEALNVFFRQSRDVTTNLQQLQVEDFHNRNTAEPIEVTVTFTELSAQAQEDFRHYYRQRLFADGGLYRYFAVPESVYRSLLAAPSAGRFFHQRIRDAYSYVRV
jgi:hypothetical protein